MKSLAQFCAVNMILIAALNVNPAIAEDVTWDGSGDMNWTDADSTSWSGGTYDDGDAANFLGAGAGTVSIAAGGVNPGAVVVDSSANYTFSVGSIGGTGSLTKAGSATLTLSATNSYSGGTVINAGTVSFSTDLNFGATSGGIIFNGGGLSYSDGRVLDANRTFTISTGATLTLGANITVNGVLSGDGTLNPNSADEFIFPNANNDFSGTITAATGGSTTYGLRMASIGDGAGAGLINLGTTTTGGTFMWIKASGGSTTFVNRQFALSGTTGGGVISARGTNVTETLIINKDLLVTGVGNKTLTLCGVNTGINQFAGNITDGAGSVISLSKTEAGTWALSGTNTYSGNTALLASGTTGELSFQGTNSLSPNTKLVFAQSSSNRQRARFLDDGSGTIYFNRPIEFGGGNTSQILGLFIGNNNTANGGISSGTTTDSTIQIGDITFTSVASDTATTSIDVTGANNYRLATGTITLNNLVSRSAGSTTTTKINPTTASVTAGDITVAAGNQGRSVDGIPVLSLDGTTSSNFSLSVQSRTPQMHSLPARLSV